MKNLIAIPTYNEFGNIDSLIEAINKENLNTDILFIDDNSQDKTQDAIKKNQINYSNIKLISRDKKIGVGDAHLKAIEYAFKNNYNILVTMDADFTHNPKYIKEMISLTETVHLVVGSRHIKKNSIDTWPIIRKFLTNCAFFVTKNFLKIDFDATSGFRCYNLDKLNPEFFTKIKSKSYSFFVESSYEINKNLIVRTLPIDMPIRFAEKSKMKIKDMSFTILLILRLFFSRFIKF